MPVQAKRRQNGIGVESIALATLIACGGGGGDAAGPPPPGTPKPVAAVSVSPSLVSLFPGETRQLTAVARAADGTALAGRTVSWTTSNGAVATVSSTGLATGRTAGSAVITASVEGIAGTADISVTDLAQVQYASVAAGGAHTCGLTNAGAARCWGRNESGQLGASTTTSCTIDGAEFSCSLVPMAVATSVGFSTITAGGAHTCALAADGTAYCWGNNASGQLGDNSTTNRSAPTQVATTQRFASITAGSNHTCAVTSNGSGFCWGSNSRGQLGDGSTQSRSAPTPVSGALSFQTLSAGGFNIGHTCGVANSGDAYCWGDNERGQLGSGSADVSAHSSPTIVSGGLTFATLSAGLGRHTCAVTTAGSAFCWGQNTFGALGNGMTADRSVPTAVFGELTFAQVIAGGFIGHSCGVTPAGVGYCWGENERGQVGDGTTIDRLSPSAVTGGVAFSKLSLGFRHSCGRASTGTLYCWGSGAAGQLGTNSQSSVSSPTKVLGQP